MKDKIIDILTPYIGKAMSISSLELQCKKLGISVDSIGKKDLETVAERLHPALKLFIGDSKTNQIIELIKKL